MCAITIRSYPAAIERLERDGYLFDVGQIDGRVVSQLYMARNEGLIRVTQDSWPIRGCGRGSGEWRTVYELAHGAQRSRTR